MEPAQWLKHLEQAHSSELRFLTRLNKHYDGMQPLSYMHPELVLKLGDRLRQVIVNWPQLVVDSLEERLDIEGFRLGGAAEADDDLWGVFQANGLDGLTQQAHVDAMVMRRSYAVVGDRDEADVDPASGVDVSVPLITVESPLEMFSWADPRTRRTVAAVKWWDDGNPASDVKHATLYLPDETSWWVKDGRGWEPDPAYPVFEHGKGAVPVVPIVNRPRLRRPEGQLADGVSDLDPIIPLSDAACKIATDMMVGAEFHALPRRWALGFKEEDFIGPDGAPLNPHSIVAGALWATERSRQDGAEVGQFAESALSNYHATLDQLAKLVASVSGLPPHYLGMATANPASADAIRSAEARLVKRAERKQRAFGEAWEQVMRLALLWRDGKVPGEAARMETLWRDASTPTVAQSADAAVKLNAQGVVPLRQTREDLGYSETQIDRMEAEDLKAQVRAAATFGLIDPGKPPLTRAPDIASQAPPVSEPAGASSAV